MGSRGAFLSSRCATDHRLTNSSKVFQIQTARVDRHAQAAWIFIDSSARTSSRVVMPPAAVIS